jgi:hypothetical protein
MRPFLFRTWYLTVNINFSAFSWSCDSMFTAFFVVLFFLLCTFQPWCAFLTVCTHSWCDHLSCSRSTVPFSYTSALFSGWLERLNECQQYLQQHMMVPHFACALWVGLVSLSLAGRLHTLMRVVPHLLGFWIFLGKLIIPYLVQLNFLWTNLWLSGHENLMAHLGTTSWQVSLHPASVPLYTRFSSVF